MPSSRPDRYPIPPALSSDAFRSSSSCSVIRSMAREFSINSVMLSENHAVGVEIEVFGTEKLDDAVVVFVVDENGAEKRPLCINAAGKGPF